jgi:hypothetical protein
MGSYSFVLGLAAWNQLGLLRDTQSEFLWASRLNHCRGFTHASLRIQASGVGRPASNQAELLPWSEIRPFGRGLPTRPSVATVGLLRMLIGWSPETRAEPGAGLAIGTVSD